MGAATVRLGGIAAVVLAWSLVAQGAVDPGVATAPRMEFTAPQPGTYRLPVIQSVADAQLLDASGTVQHLDRFTHGKVTLLTFFYTRCADPLGCPFGYVILSQLRARVLVDKQLRRAVRFVDISLDPVNDTPEVVRRYAGPLSTDSRSEWSFLTARSVPQLLPILDDLGQDVSVASDPQGHPTRVLHHMLKVFLIDARGRVREIYSLAYLQPEVMMSDLRTVLMDVDLRSSTDLRNPRG